MYISGTELRELEKGERMLSGKEQGKHKPVSMDWNPGDLSGTHINSHCLQTR